MLSPEDELPELKELYAQAVPAETKKVIRKLWCDLRAKDEVIRALKEGTVES